MNLNTDDFIIEPYKNTTYYGWDSEVTYDIISVEGDEDKTTFVFNIKGTDDSDSLEDLEEEFEEYEIYGEISYICKLSFSINNKFLRIDNKTLLIDVDDLDITPFNNVLIEYKSFNLSELQAENTSKKKARSIIEKYYDDNKYSEENLEVVLPFGIEFKLK